MILNYAELIAFKDRHAEVDRETIAANLRSIKKERKLKSVELSEIMDISIHTVYAYTKDRGYPVKPDPFALLLLASYLKIDSMCLLEKQKEE